MFWCVPVSPPYPPPFGKWTPCWVPNFVLQRWTPLCLVGWEWLSVSACNVMWKSELCLQLVVQHLPLLEFTKHCDNATFKGIWGATSSTVIPLFSTKQPECFLKTFRSYRENTCVNQTTICVLCLVRKCWRCLRLLLMCEKYLLICCHLLLLLSSETCWSFCGPPFCAGTDR